MPRKINRILSAICFISLIILTNHTSTAQQVSTSIIYLPDIPYEWSDWIGPFTGYLVNLAIDPSNPQVVYAGSWGSGVYKSLDGGQSWKAVNHGLGNLYINSMTIDPIHPSTVYAGTYKNQVYKTVDGGINWSWSGTGMQDQAIVYTLAVDPEAPATLYAGTRGISNNGNPPWKGIIYKSVDAGQSWMPILTDVGGTESQDWAYSITVNSNDHQVVYVATHEHGPYRSKDYGNIWYPLDAGITDFSGRAIAVSPDFSVDTILFYGVWHFDAVYKSLNGGDDWFTSNGDIEYTRVYNIEIDPVQPDNIYLATFTRGVLKSVDGGSHWREAGLQADKVYQLAIDPTATGTLYTGTAGDGIYKSLDGGNTWQPKNTGIDNAMATKVILSTSEPDRFYTSIYGAGVFESNDRGGSWVAMNTGLGDKFVHTLVQFPSPPEILYALTNTGGLFKNDLNNGTGWVRVGDGLPLATAHLQDHPINHPISTHEVIDPVDATAYPRTNGEPESASLLAMSFAASNPQIAYLGTSGSGVYKSSDGGTTWQPAGLDGATIQCLAVDPLDPNLVYAATSGGGVLKISQDGGVIWTDSPLPVTFYTLVVNPSPPGGLYAGTNDGLYYYQSGIWTSLGLSGKVVTAIALDNTRPGRMYAGTTSGAFYTSNGGLSWEALNWNLNDLSIESIDVDPVHPERLYISTQTHGIFYISIHH